MKNRITHQLSLVILTVSLFSCAKTNKPDNCYNCGALYASFTTPDVTITFKNSSDSYISLTGLFFDNNTFYVEIDARLPYEWKKYVYMDDHSTRYSCEFDMYYFDSSNATKVIKKVVSGFMDENKETIESIPATSDGTYYIYFKMEDGIDIETTTHYAFVFAEYVPVDKANYNAYDIPKEYLTIGFNM